LNAVSDANDRDNGDADLFDVLLKLNAAVVCDEHLKSSVNGSTQEDTVSKAEPALTANGGGFVARKFGS
jgi:hypothetical protein